MNSFMALLKYDLINSYGINKVLNKKDKKEFLKSLLILFAIVLGFVSFGFYFYMYYSMMAQPLKEMNFLSMILGQGMILSVMAILFTSIYKASGTIFGIKDYDMLISLPIKPWMILIVKIINLMIINYVFMAVVIVPSFIVYYMNTDTSIFMFINAFIMYWFIPLIPVSIAAFLGYIVTYIASKFRYKNLITIIGFVALTIGILILPGYMEKIIGALVKNSQSISNIIEKIYLPLKFYTEGISEVSIMAVIKFILISVLVFTVFIVLLNKAFVKINSRFIESYKKNNFKMTDLKESSVIKALLKKEIRRYFSQPMVVLNTAGGMLLYIVSAVMVVFMGGEALMKILEVDMVKELIPGLVLVIVSFMIVTTCTTSTSISLEGNSFWILKSMPIKTMDIFKAKIFLNLIIIVPAIFIGAPLFIFGFKLNIAQGMWLIIIPILLAFFVAQLGLIINLIFPVMEWTSEVAVVKRSLSVIVTMLIGLITIAGLISIYFWLKVSNLNLYILCSAIIVFVLDLIFYRVLKTWGTRKLWEI